MKRRAKVSIAVAAGAFGALLGGGLTWSMMSSPSHDDEPVRAVRSPCNLIDERQLRQVLPNAVIVSETLRLTEPGDEGQAHSRCVVGVPGEDPRRLSLSVVRHGDTTHRPRRSRQEFTRSAVDAARGTYDSGVRYPDVACVPRPVAGVGEQAAVCVGAYQDGQAYLVVARRGVVVVVLVAQIPSAGREPHLHGLARLALEAV